MENQELMGQFLENRQNYMMDNNSIQHMNMNVASAGCGDSVVGGGVQADMVSGVGGGVAGEILGVKYDEHHHEEHDVGDDDELKYVKEVQQSEKQQQQSLKNFGLDADDDDATNTYEHSEFAEKEVINASAHHFGNGDGGFVFGGDHHLEQPQQHHHDLFNMGNGHDTNGHNDFGNTHGFEEKLNFESHDIDGFKADADFSSSTNVTESADGFVVPQVDVKIETKPEQLPEMQDEEEPSSLATNTTNGTSSLSENVPAPQAVAEAQSNTNDEFDDFMSNLEDKENADPLTPQRPAELDLDLNHSQLNPDAKEFVPSFGSNPASPSSPFPTGEPTNEEDIILSETMETQMYFGQAPIAVPRHLLNDDDFVAQSPRKGKGDNDLDTVPLPKALAEFEKEADQRPHEPETEQRDEVMTPDQAIQQLPLDDLALDKELEQSPIADTTDFQPSSFMDHGPETCVDTDLDMQPAEHLSSLTNEDDVMKRSIYVANDEAIEDVLNSVQPIPTEIDSVNNSFIEESATESAANQLANDKELLQVEEKEHVSHSPSTEEIQMNLQNALNSSNKDIPQLPIDMDNANNMQESMYMEHQDQDRELLNEKQQDLLDDQLDHNVAEEHKDLQVEKENVEFQEYFHEQAHQEKPFDQEDQHLPEQKEEFIEKPIEEEEIKHLTEEVVAEKLSEELLTKEQTVEEEPIKHEEQQILDEFQSQSAEQQLHDEEFNQTHQPSLDEFENQTEEQQHFDVKDESLLVEPASSLVSNESFLDTSPVTHEQQQEIHESYSPFKISDEFTSAPAPTLDALNVDTSEDHHQQQALSDILTPSSTADEKHLLEETKEEQQQQQQEQQSSSIMSDLEQQMNEMMITNNDGNLLQAEEIPATPATNTIEDISENLISPDEAVVVSHDQKEQEQMFADDSAFNQFEAQPPQAEFLSAHEPEKEKEIEHIQEPVQEEQKQQIEQHVEDNVAEQIPETIESPIQQEYHQELESEMVAVEEPIIEAKQATQLFTNNQETENETKIEEEQQHVVEEKPIEEQPIFEEKPIEEVHNVAEKPVEVAYTEEKQPTEEVHIEEKPIEQHQEEISLSMVPETAPAELLEPSVEEQKEEISLSLVPETAPAELLQPSMEESQEDISLSMVPETTPAQILEASLEGHQEEISLSMVPETAPAELLESSLEERQEEISLSMVPETAPAELLEPPMELTKQEEQPKPIEEVVVSEPIKETVVEEVKPKVEEEVKPDVAVEAAVVAATVAIAATAAVGAKIAASPAKKTETAKKPLAKSSTTTAKPKVGTTPAAKKPAEVAKKPAGLAAKPRTSAPAKPTSATTATGEKKPISKTTTSTTTTTARKPLSASSATASKPAAKPSSTMTSTTRTTSAKPAATARPTTAPRTLTSSTTTRKPAAATTNGPLAKPRPATAPAKPTTLGLSATNGGAPKTKPTSPRAPLTSQVRKTTTTTTTAKSPVKSTATNGVTKTASSTLASKTKTSSSTTVTSAASKTFTARPAPKFTHSSSSTTTTTTTRRLTVGGTTATASSTTTTTKTSSTPLRKSTPTKPATARTPLKSTPTGAAKSKTPTAKTTSSTEKPAPIRKPVDKTIKSPAINGDINEAAAIKDINGGTAAVNGDLQAVQESQEQQQNGDTSIPMQNDEPSLLETSNRDGQLPLDVINA